MSFSILSFLTLFTLSAANFLVEKEPPEQGFFAPPPAVFALATLIPASWGR